MSADKSDWVLDRVLRQRAESMAEKPFLEVVGDRCESYRETYEAALRLAARLEQLGVGKGDTVVIMAPNSFEAVHAWIAANMLGAIDVTINTAYRGQLLEHALNMAQARIILLDEEFLPVLRDSEAKLPQMETAVHFRTHGNNYEAAPPQFERIALRPLWEAPERPLSNATGQADFRETASVIYTSGTTGPAKGVMMPHAQTHYLAQQTIAGLRLREDDVFYCFHPLFHMAGKFMGIYATMLAGGKIVLDARFAAEHWLERVRQYGATVGLAHGPMIEMIFDQPAGPNDRDNPMRRILACPFPKHIALEFERRFDLRGYEVWGMTEINTPCWTPYDEPVRLGSCGKIMEDAVDFQIVDPETDEPVPDGETGEFVVRHKEPWTLMQGYMGMPEKTNETWRNLWFHTGDMGYRDTEGYIYFVDRFKDRIRRRAENISSYDIEVVAATHPAIAECAALGVASEFVSDDDIKLCAVLADGAALEPAALIEFLVEGLPYYMVPRYIEFLDALPRTPTNKIKKAEMRAEGITENTWDRQAAGVSVRQIVEAARQQKGSGQ
ncbi:MAG: AMP-binding protein [Alphaproteobacteria bacterium]|nr:AMP-binding protein [Alphaproteobacteria bacterium]